MLAHVYLGLKAARLTMICILGVALVTSVTGCNQDECEPLSTTCDGNRLMRCGPGVGDAFDYARWALLMDCSMHNATCEEGETASLDLHRDRLNIESDRSHGCAVRGFACDGDTDLHCVEDNSLIVRCSYTQDPFAMIVARNERYHPLCIERSNGLAGFAHIAGECESNREFACMNDWVRVSCYGGLWSMEFEACAGLEQQMKCEASTDSDGYSASQCVPYDSDTNEEGTDSL